MLPFGHTSLQWNVVARELDLVASSLEPEVLPLKDVVYRNEALKMRFNVYKHCAESAFVRSGDWRIPCEWNKTGVEVVWLQFNGSRPSNDAIWN